MGVEEEMEWTLGGGCGSKRQTNGDGKGMAAVTQSRVRQRLVVV